MTCHNSVNNLFLTQKVVQVTTDYTVLPDDVIIEVGALSAPITLTLPTASSENRGKFYLIKDGSGTAQTHQIKITDPASTIDGSSNYTIKQNYGSVQLFSTGLFYCTYGKNFSIKQETTLGKAAWTGNVYTKDNSPQTKIDSVIKDWATTLIPVQRSSDPRVDFAGLTCLYLDNDRFKLAADARSITFTTPGLYHLLLNAGLLYDQPDHLPRTPLVQLIKNATTIIKACPTYDRVGTDLNASQIVYLGNFAANDTIDLRFAYYREANRYQIFFLDFSIQQLATYRYHSFF